MKPVPEARHGRDPLSDCVLSRPMMGNPADEPGSCPDEAEGSLTIEFGWAVEGEIPRLRRYARALRGGGVWRAVGRPRRAFSSREGQLFRQRAIKRSDMSRSRNLDRVTRYQWFESGFLQRRVMQTIGSCALTCGGAEFVFRVSLHAEIGLLAKTSNTIDAGSAATEPTVNVLPP
jgi:hypothetical protein